MRGLATAMPTMRGQQSPNSTLGFRDLNTFMRVEGDKLSDDLNVNSIASQPGIDPLESAYT